MNKRISKILSLMLSALMLFSVVLTGCTPTEAPEENTNAPGTSENENGTESTTEGGGETDIPADSGEALTSAPPKTLKILAIGNSFSTDAMQHLYHIAKSGGVETVVIANLYYGGCSLSQHNSFAETDSASYKYYKNTSGSWVSTSNYKMSQALADEEWDYITLQQTSKTSGIASDYSALEPLVSYIRERNSTAKLVWHMTWAYQQDSTHSSFPNYGKDQTRMYNMIVDVVKTVVVPTGAFDIVIPTGTSIQNARTSFLGDTLTRDGYHLDLMIGRYIAGLTYFAAITNAPIENIQYSPSATLINDEMIKVAKEAVTNAIKHPYEVTQSAITEGSRPSGSVIDPSAVLDPHDFLVADTNLASGYGIDLSKYTLLEWDYLENQYWNCTSRAETTVPASSSSTYKQNVCSTRKYSLSELPIGTIFIVDDGWQFRLDTYVSENAKYTTGKRLDMFTANLTVFTAELVRDCNYFAWNISSNPKSDISEYYQQASCHLRIYIPNLSE